MKEIARHARAISARCPSLLLALLLASVMPACGMGVGATVHSLGLARTTPDELTGTKSETSATLFAPTIQLYDTTGILLAILGNAARGNEARENALRNARPGETVTYSWEPIAPMPGALTTLLVSWGATDSGSKSDLAEPVMVDFFDFELMVDFWKFDIAKKFEGHLVVGALWRQYEVADPFNDDSQFWIGMPFGFKLAYAHDFGDHELFASAYAYVDPLISGLTALTMDPGGSWFWGRFGLRGDLSLLSWLGLSVDTYYESSPLDFGKLEEDSCTFTVSLNAFYVPDSQDP